MFLKKKKKKKWEAANAQFLLLAKLCGVTPSMRGAHVFTSRDIFYVNQKTPPHQNWQVTICFSLCRKLTTCSLLRIVRHNTPFGPWLGRTIRNKIYAVKCCYRSRVS